MNDLLSMSRSLSLSLWQLVPNSNSLPMQIHNQLPIHKYKNIARYRYDCVIGLCVWLSTTTRRDETPQQAAHFRRRWWDKPQPRGVLLRVCVVFFQSLFASLYIVYIYIYMLPISVYIVKILLYLACVIYFKLSRETGRERESLSTYWVLYRLLYRLSYVLYVDQLDLSACLPSFWPIPRMQHVRWKQKRGLSFWPEASRSSRSSCIWGGVWRSWLYIL